MEVWVTGFGVEQVDDLLVVHLIRAGPELHKLPAVTHLLHDVLYCPRYNSIVNVIGLRLFRHWHVEVGTTDCVCFAAASLAVSGAGVRENRL